jgi:hypothetical protein
MRIRISVAVAAIAAIAAVSAPAALANHSWGGYHWARTANPFTVQLGDNVSGLWDGMLVTASSDWTQSSVLDTTIVAGGTRPKPCRATLGRVEVCSARYGNTGWLGVATIWLQSGTTHIVQGTVKNNDYYFGRDLTQHLHGLLPQHLGLRSPEHPPELARLPGVEHDLRAPRLDHHRRRTYFLAPRPPGADGRVEVRRAARERVDEDHVRPLGDSDPHEPLSGISA